MPTPDEFYTESNRKLQGEHDSLKLADAVVHAIVDDESMVTPLRVRVQGEAKLSQNADYLEKFPGANMIVEVDITSVFYNCARYIHKHERVEASKYVPNAKGEQPFPAWKRIDGLQEVLQPKDIGRAAEEGGVITEAEYEAKVMEGTS